MGTTLKFLGAAGNVTGSRYLLDTGTAKVLVDCGLYQEREYQERNWEKFDVEPRSIDAAVLTHAHLDHCGLLPKLAHDGFRGKVFCTPVTAELAQLVLKDSAHIQAEDLKFKQKRHRKEKRTGPFPYRPLYDENDVEKLKNCFRTGAYAEPIRIAAGVTATFYNAGHILGSSMALLRVEGGPAVLFSGDLGRRNRPILRDPDVPEPADYVVTESTYGDRLHEDDGDIAAHLEEVILDTVRRGGKLIVPSFAIERSQEVLYVLNTLVREGRISRLPVYLDSPMAVAVTEIFRHHPERYDDEMRALMAAGRSPFEFEGLHLVGSTEESKAINDVRGPAVILAGSGMCTGGRIKHHLDRHLEHPENTVLFVGYQASGTLGRELLDGAEEVRLFARRVKVRACIAQIRGFSGHADRDELLQFLTALPAAPKRLFVTHGGSTVSRKFAEFVAEKTGWDVTAPAYHDAVELP